MENIITIIGILIPFIIAIINNISDIYNLFKKKPKPTKAAEFDEVLSIIWNKYPKNWIPHMRHYFKFYRNLFLIYSFLFTLIMLRKLSISNINLQDITENNHFTNISNTLEGIAMIALYWFSFYQYRLYNFKIKNLKNFLGNTMQIKVKSDFNYILNRCIKTLMYLDSKIISIDKKKLGELDKCIITSKNEKILITINQITSKEYIIAITVNPKLFKEFINISISQSILKIFKLNDLLNQTRKEMEKFTYDFIT